MNSTYKPVFTFFALVFVLSIPFWILGGLNPVELLPGLPISALAAFTPAIAALLLAFIKDRRSGAMRLLGRSFDFRRIKNAAWLLVILLINPLIAFGAYAAMRLAGRTLPSPTPLSWAILPMFLFFFIAALGEELGWTGYATEILSPGGTLSTGLSIGVVWAVWHFIALLQAQRPAAWIAWWSLGTIALRLIIVWLYVNAGRSVFGASLFHAMINLCWQLFPNNGSHYDPQVFGLLTLGLAVVLLLAQPWITGQRQPAV